MGRLNEEEEAESSLHGRLEASKERWRDEPGAERQRGAFKETWGDEEGTDRSLHGRLEASKEGWRDATVAERQREAFKQRWGD